MMSEPSRGEVWTVTLDPTRGHEQAGMRPALVLSVDRFNHGPAGLVVVLPITSRAKGILFHVPLARSEGGLKTASFVKCEDIRCIAKERMIRRWGRISAAALSEVEDRVRILLGL